RRAEGKPPLLVPLLAGRKFARPLFSSLARPAHLPGPPATGARINKWLGSGPGRTFPAPHRCTARMLRNFIFISLSLLPHLLLILGGSTGTSDLNRAARVTRQARTSVLTVGAIIESDDEVRQIAVARAVDQANAFFASRMDRVSLTHDIRQISPGDSFQANREACSCWRRASWPSWGRRLAAAEQYELMLNKLETPVITRQWVKKSGSYKHILTDLKNAGVFGYFVDIPVEDVLKFMILAKAMNMTSANHSYIFTSWVGGSDGQLHSDLHAAAGAPAGQYGRGPAVERMRAEIFNIETQRAQYRGLLENMIPMAAAIVFDSIQLLANGIHFTSRAQPVEPQPMTCGTGQRFWQNGASLLNFMRSIPEDISPQTLTGACEVRLGLEAAHQLAANSMKGTFAFLQIGSWDRLHGFNISRTFQEPLEEVQKKLQNKTLRVTTVEDAPFIKVKNKNDSNNPPQFDGFCIQMLNLIAQEAGFNFTVRLVEDGNYGTKNWQRQRGQRGLERHDRGAHRQVAPLTITYERERVIDFTTPYMSLGLSILFKKPVKTKPHLFSFLSPLSPTLQRQLKSSILNRCGARYWRPTYSSASCFFVVAQLSPYEWYNPNPCSTDTEQVENQFSMLNSLWFTVGSLMQQGSEIWPRALSTRLISGIWWFFTLIMISSYTANLAAFLTVERMHSPIESVEDLARQTKIKYGTLASGSTYQFFKARLLGILRLN
uniref:PBPe domain-containing protein n=1 Tax=Macrostomum lignano TaxID=282301 RepID=A0A1I8FMY9_9PLAT